MSTAVVPSTAKVARLHVITPDGAARQVIEAAAAVLAAGAPTLQLRCKRGTDRERFGVGVEIRNLCRSTGASLIVDDRVDLAMALGADGVHLGADDLPVPVARSLMGPGTLIGATCRTATSARQAERDGASYLGVGPAFSTNSKDGLPEPLGLDGITEVASATGLPVIAIAGITPGRVSDVVGAGAWGVAVIGAIFAEADPADATRTFLAALAAASA